jgi:threonyl-tRNA synthetase
MFRVRQITMDDAHIYCRPDQILSEIDGLIELVTKFYAVFGLQPGFNLSTKPDGAMGDAALWTRAEESLRQALEKNGIVYKVNAKDGAFYGPKIDIQIEDAIGRQWQVATIQLDFVMLPERFELEYIAEDGSRKRPVAIHRAIFGSFERFIGIITEHFAGAFPLWLTPVQAVVLPITDNHRAYAETVTTALREAGIRAELDDRNEKVNLKIRESELKKIPYMLVVGDKEIQSHSVAVRVHTKGDAGSMPVGDVVKKLQEEITEKLTTLQEMNHQRN